MPFTARSTKANLTFCFLRVILDEQSRWAAWSSLKRDDMPTLNVLYIVPFLFAHFSFATMML